MNEAGFLAVARAFQKADRASRAAEESYNEVRGRRDAAGRAETKVRIQAARVAAAVRTRAVAQLLDAARQLEELDDRPPSHPHTLWTTAYTVDAVPFLRAWCSCGAWDVTLDVCRADKGIDCEILHAMHVNKSRNGAEAR